MPGQEDLDALKADIQRAQQEQALHSRFGSWKDFDLEGNNQSVGETEIKDRFGFHRGTIEGPNATAPRHDYLRVAFMEFADMLDRVLPPGRAKSVAFTELETASMWVHKSIASLAPVVDPRG
jgi:hypothetical protein